MGVSSPAAQATLSPPAALLSAPEGTALVRRVHCRLTILALAAHVAGALLTYLYFSAVDPLPADRAAMDTLGRVGPRTFALVIAAALIAGLLWQRRAQGRVRRWLVVLDRLPAGDPLPEPPLDVRREVLNRPFQSAVAGWSVWLAVGLACAGAIVVGVPGAAAVAGRLFAGITLVGGTLTTAIVFFGTELLWRQVAPVFFPSGGLGDVPAAYRLSVLGRLRIAFLLVGVVPPSLLAVLSLRITRAAAMSPEPQGMFRDQAATEGFILVASLLASTAMAAFVTRGIVGPLRTLQAAMGQVEQGHLQARVLVRTNDELGYLGERFNRMVAGLREREHIRTMFGQYVTQQVADAVLRGEVKLGGDRREVTMLMTDIRDFTTLSEGMEPEALVSLLNRYLGLMIDAIVAHGGTLDKFVGDGIVAEFNAPLDQAQHALRAVLAALGMRERLAAFNAAQAAGGEPTLRIGMGIHTGPAVVGNIGAEGKKLEYTAMGDTVNVAGRLESLTKELGNDICLSAATYALVRQWVDVSAPLAVHVKGRAAPVTVYQLCRLRPGVKPPLDRR